MKLIYNIELFYALFEAFFHLFFFQYSNRFELPKVKKTFSGFFCGNSKRSSFSTKFFRVNDFHLSQSYENFKLDICGSIDIFVTVGIDMNIVSDFLKQC